VYQKLLKFWKGSDQGRRSRLVTEKKKSGEKMENSHRNPTGSKGMLLFTFLPVKSSVTMSNRLINRTAFMDLISGDKGRNIGEACAGLHKYLRQSGNLSRRTTCSLV